jgi:uncharacterized membrane protein YfcA
MQIIVYIALGVLIGAYSGLIGLGGGTLLIPILVYGMQMTQQAAQGTTLAMMVPPISILAAWVYYREGNCDIRVATLLCIGFTVGSYFGAKWANAIPTWMLQKIFALALMGISVQMLLKK